MRSKIFDVINLYIEDEMYEIYENIITAEKTAHTQVNAAFEAHFAPTSSLLINVTFSDN